MLHTHGVLVDIIQCIGVIIVSVIYGWALLIIDPVALREVTQASRVTCSLLNQPNVRLGGIHLVSKDYPDFYIY